MLVKKNHFLFHFPGMDGIARQRDSRRIVLTLLKLRGVILMLLWGLTVLCAEADISYLTDPIPEVALQLAKTTSDGTPAYDMVFQAEAPFLPNLTAEMCADEPNQHLNSTQRGAAGLQCMGIYAARPTNMSISILDHADSFVLKRAIKSMFRRGGFQAAYIHEQYGVNIVVRSDNTTWSRLGEFDRCRFAHGHDYFKRSYFEDLKLSPVLVHAVSVAPKEAYLRRVRWEPHCSTGRQTLLSGQRGWIREASVAADVGTAYYMIWQLLFSRTETKHIDSYASQFRKRWRTLERKEESKRASGRLCYYTEKNCTYDEG